MNFYLFCCLVFSAWAAAVAFGDYRARRVPNALVAFGFCAALAASLLHAGPARIGPGQALTAGLVGGAVLLPFFALGVMGAGDVKVFAVLGAWCGFHALPMLWLVASLAAGLHGLWIIVPLGLQKLKARSQAVQTIRVGGRRGAPYAAFLTLPAVAWLAWQLVVAGGAR